jgi:NADH dehydrogenase
VTPEHVIYTTKNAQGQTEQHTIPSNFVLWSTGIAMNPFTSRVSDLLPNQVHKKAIEVDAHLRVKGAPLGDVYAIGDCSTVRGPGFIVHTLAEGRWADRDVGGEPLAGPCGGSGSGW